MAKEVTRTIFITEVKASTIIVKDGAPSIVDSGFTITSTSAPTEKEIEKALPKGAVIISNNTVEKVYAISFEDFIKYGKEIVRTESQRKKGGNKA